MNDNIRGTLHDQNPEVDTKVGVSAVLYGNSIQIEAERFNNKNMDDDRHLGDGYRAVAILEVWEGELRLIVWADINQEDPTHTIDLSGAKVSARKPEVELLPFTEPVIRTPTWVSDKPNAQNAKKGSKLYGSWLEKYGSATSRFSHDKPYVSNTHKKFEPMRPRVSNAVEDSVMIVRGEGDNAQWLDHRRGWISDLAEASRFALREPEALEYWLNREIRTYELKQEENKDGNIS